MLAKHQTLFIVITMILSAVGVALGVKNSSIVPEVRIERIVPVAPIILPTASPSAILKLVK